MVWLYYFPDYSHFYFPPSLTPYGRPYLIHIVSTYEEL